MRNCLIYAIGVLLFFQFNTLHAQNFEGDLVYSHQLSIINPISGSTPQTIIDYNEIEGAYDSFKIVFKDANYKKILDKSPKETIYLDFPNKKAIYFVAGEKFIMLDKLSFRNHINRPYDFIGEIVNIEKKDSLVSKFDLMCTVLIVEGTLGTEEYIYSDKLPKLSFNRNILVAEEFQNFPSHVSEDIDRSILLYYQLNIKNVSRTFELRSITPRNVDAKEVVFINFKEKAKDRRFNKSSLRFKMYSLDN